MTEAFEIETETWPDRTCVKARGTVSGETLAMGMHYTRERTARLWDRAALERGLRDQPERPTVLYGLDVASLTARVAQAASVAEV